jgi:NAD+ diphosphatase
MALESFTNVFAGNPLERHSYRRTDAEWLTARLDDPNSLAIALWNGKPLVEDAKSEDGKGDGLQIAYVSTGLAKAHSVGWERLLFLGLWRETAVFAVDFDGDADPADGPLQGLGRFEDLRAVATSLPPAEAAILAAGRQVFEWRRKHRHCSACGAATEAVDGGWKRHCKACGTEHFPRTDPVVIMLPVNGERCLLGRQAVWPKGMYSALAGFVEPGESIEEACARELFEEAAVRARKVRYHSTQPWPYPMSLMIGLIAELEDGEATADNQELDEVRWFTREEAGQLVRGDHASARAPGALAIAHQLIRAWAEETS